MKAVRRNTRRILASEWKEGRGAATSGGRFLEGVSVCLDFPFWCRRETEGSRNGKSNGNGNGNGPFASGLDVV
ncbi:hypothetical protein CCHR01_09260 [Colletotrichum chrysophilum]|uniref:Uncharacterized protein n=1 Tax=Colletotrichum chrysophilum TaxID=1836956 RepID=A0AAD9AJI3_9PEZI|nr:hypothetical protein CCHR01_09260 [Colletotrichum chrysophilum]